MKRDNINYLVVGIFVLGLFVLLMLLVYELTGRAGPSDSYNVTYSNVAGIKYGTPVLYEGYQVGQVESIEPVRTDAGMRYRLALSVTRDWRIPEDSVARVVASGLLSTMTIEISEGDSDTMLEPGSEMTGREAVSLMSTVNDVAADFRQLSQHSLRPLLDTAEASIRQLTADMNQLANEDIRPLFRNMNQQLNDADFISEANKLVAKLNRAADGLEEIFAENNRRVVADTLVNLETASTGLNSLLGNLEDTRENMDDVLTGIDRVVVDNEPDMQAAVRELRTTLEMISANIDTITYHLEGTSRNMHEFSRHLRANPGALLRNTAPPDEAVQEDSSHE